MKAQNKDVIIRLKNQNYDIKKDADGLFKNKPPVKIVKNVKIRGESRNVSYDLEIWDEEGLTSWEQTGMPLRVLKVRETKKIPHIKTGKRKLSKRKEKYMQ